MDIIKTIEEFFGFGDDSTTKTPEKPKRTTPAKKVAKTKAASAPKKAVVSTKKATTAKTKIASTTKATAKK
ncbi:MAG TPA: hypothetical protein PKN96_11025 [Flavobacterium sp.]|uniref:hypothetical protein n=1 Tax=Flavobacterium sp. TaxID=239 RepID=UPI002BEAD559|nr:hypothetical protein [Flavobacterium sp.]HNP33814.1 hypothetical protein [Flavobacterium sp.]